MRTAVDAVIGGGMVYVRFTEPGAEQAARDGAVLFTDIGRLL